MPKVASSMPAGNGGLRRAPETKCFSGTGMAVARPRSASSFVIIETLCKPNMASSPLEDDFLVAELLNSRRREAAGGQDLVRVLGAQRRRAPDPGGHARELEGCPHHGDLAEARMEHALDDPALDRLRIVHHLVHGI